MDLGFPPEETAAGRHQESANILESLVAAVNDHDTYTGGHSYRAADYAAGIAASLGYAPLAIEVVRQAALVHDIGKIGIPDRILRKPDDLTPDELHLLRLHPVLGASILSRMPDTQRLIPIVLHHHERWDGTGYPDGLRGIEIPVESRIILVADAFDAMTTERPYGRVMSPEEALTEIGRYSGTQFDPLMVDAATNAYHEGRLTVGGNRTIKIMDPEPHSL